MAQLARLAAGALTGVLLIVALGACSSAPSPGVTPASTGLAPRGAVVTDIPVLRVVDGDTLHVLIEGRDTTVRLLGIDTPETVKPGSPVECFGPEASEFAKHLLDGQRVTLEFDDSQGRLDRYGRTLAYAWLPVASGGQDLVNLDLVARGFARQRQYGPDPVAWQPELVAAQAQARSSGTGLWGACTP